MRMEQSWSEASTRQGALRTAGERPGTDCPWRPQKEPALADSLISDFQLLSGRG